MVAVALSALVPWGWVLWGRSEQYARKAEEYRLISEDYQTYFYNYTHDPRGDDKSYPMIEWKGNKLEFYRNKLDHAERLYRKYRRAAKFPWLTPEADSPEPLPTIR
jgi:hypothetical protein